MPRKRKARLMDGIEGYNPRSMIALGEEKQVGRPRPPEEADAYYKWARMIHKADPHAIARLSQLTGIAAWKLRDWRERYEWDKRWVDETHAVSANLFKLAHATMLQNMQPVIDNLARIAREGQDRDAVNATKVFAGILGLITPSGNQGQAAVSTINIDKAVILDQKTLAIDEMRELAKSAAQGNIDAVHAARLSKRQLSSKGLIQQ